MNLWELDENSTAKITGISEEIHRSHSMRLVELGFRCDEEVRCIRHTPFKGPRVYLVGDSVFSLAEDVARSVVVQGS